MSEPGYTPPDLSVFGDEHIRLYLETDGADGHIWNDAPILILFTTGRRSGETRRSALIYGQDSDRYVIIASQGGAPTHPNWYHNLTANPDVEIQILGDRFSARARTAAGEERDRLWSVMTRVWPNYDVYTTRTNRQIPVVVLERV